jgi:hypothetical protein
MNHIVWTKRKTLIALVLIAIIAVSSVIFLEKSQTTQAALIDPHPGLVGWWRFDEGAGNIAIDSSGYGNNGTIYGATWTSGKYGNALAFDGVSNYVDVPAASTLFPSNAITIEFWVKIASADINSNAYMGFVGRGSRTNGLQIFKDWGTGRVSLETPGSGILTSTTALAPDVWNHVACVIVSSTSATIYINGQLQGSSGGWLLPTTSMDYSIGRAASGTTNPYFKGTINEVHIYNRALSAIEISSDSQTNPDFSSNMIAKIPKGTTQILVTFSWQGTGSINATIISPSQTYSEATIPVYQKTSYSTSGGLSSMLNIKRLSIAVDPVASDQSWNISIIYDAVVAYQMSVEIQK